MTKMTAEQVAATLGARKRWQIEFGSSLGAEAHRTAETLVRDHLIETDEQRRERFEAWLPTQLRTDLIPSYANRREDGSYEYRQVEEFWVAWVGALTWRGETKGGET